MLGMRLRESMLPAQVAGRGRDRHPITRLQTLACRVVALYQRARQRQALAELDEYRLRDVGITPEQARHEASKPFWRD